MHRFAQLLGDHARSDEFGGIVLRALVVERPRALYSDLPPWAMTLFWGLIAMVHWFDPRGEFHYGLAEAITSVPFVVLAALGLLRGRNDGHVDRSG
jgi:hypothetical protein